MLKLDRYLLRELAQATFAALIVLFIVSLGGVFTDVLGDIARGRVPAGLMLSQMGLQTIRYMPMILPLGLMIGLLLGFGRLYRDSEMPVLTAAGVGPGRLLRPWAWLVLPMVGLIAVCSLWLGPWAKRTSDDMIAAGNRNLLVAGLDAGRFTELPGGKGVVYVGAMSNDGTHLQRIFVYRQDKDRLDVTTATGGSLKIEGGSQRFLDLKDGFRVEGPLDAGRDYRLMRYASNELRMPMAKAEDGPRNPQGLPTTELFSDPRAQAGAQLHFRIAPPLLALAFALMAVPLARSSPRQARYGRLLLGFLAYLFGMNLMLLGTDWLGSGKLPMAAGLWWLLLPLLALGTWLYVRDGSVRRPRRHA
ncbi:MAG: LPS export ABC transporter permease LptF [Thermomonas sp.]